jgi:FkbM family methyltransferase
LGFSRRLIADFYVKLFRRKPLRRLNNFVLKAALRARGYDNYLSHEESGEAYFVNDVLSRLEPKVCVDVGAHVGSFAATLLAACRDSKVYSFEPLQAPFEQLSRLGRGHPGRLMAVNKGVGERVETLKIHYNDSATSHASFSEAVSDVPYLDNDRSADIDVVSLDHYFLVEEQVDCVDFIKIDTEGFEYEVLKGARDVLKKYKPKAIQIEFNWHQLFRTQTLLSFAQMLPDYAVYQMLPDALVMRDPKDPMSNIYLFSNFVFVRNDLRHIIP